MRKVDTGTDTFGLHPSSALGFSAASSGRWVDLGTAHRVLAIRCVRGTTVGTSNFSVTIRGSLTTQFTTGAAVGAIGAYTPTTVIAAYTQATVGKLKLSTGLMPVRYVKAVLASMTTAANRRLRVELVALP